jgi:hypothetical protein
MQRSDRDFETDFDIKESTSRVTTLTPQSSITSRPRKRLASGNQDKFPKRVKSEGNLLDSQKSEVEVYVSTESLTSPVTNMTENINKETADEHMEENSDDEFEDEFTTKLIKALSNKKVKKLFKDYFGESVQKDLKDVNDKIEAANDNIEVANDKIDSVNEKVTETDRRVAFLETEIDEFKQRDRVNNLLIQGIKEEEEENVQEKLINTLKEKLEITVTEDDIPQVFRLGKKSNTEQKDAKKTERVIKVVCKNLEKKNQILKARVKLKKKNEDIWINEDLTPRRSQLAYKARKKVKEGKAKQTWTADGKVFIKKTTEGKPTRIDGQEDLDRL